MDFIKAFQSFSKISKHLNTTSQIKHFKFEPYLNKIKVILMLKMKKVSETYDMRVFTDNGEYFGDVEESILTQNKVFGWRVRATKNSFLNKVLGSAKGVIVPHQLVKSIGDIMIISKAAVPSYSEGSESKEKDED